MQRTVSQSLKRIAQRRSVLALRGFSATASAPQLHHEDDYHYADQRQEVLRTIVTNQSTLDTMAYSLAMATTEGSGFPSLEPELSPLMKEQLRISRENLRPTRFSAGAVPRPHPAVIIDDEPLPRTLEDALRPSSRAIVVTETSRPYRVFDVNKAWVNLCEYSYVESKGQSLADLLGGPETDVIAISSLLNQLSLGEDATAVVTNYTKSGRKFRNRLHVGPLFDDDGDISHYVGVLQEVHM